ncbi:hypothetical protein Taro_040549 [Colocasia esculenta]|uniref:Uncharacterized protein n=1 Tax=Colocasia esculenta TaxID=4460 RepID=A0A843WUW8_COLES|nr:hypothetical protein [Colocasia esculenta]
MESAYHDDQKLCSTRCENSSPGQSGITFRPGIGIACVTTIRNRHFETVDKTPVSWKSVPRPKFHPGVCVLVHQWRTPLVRRGYFFVCRSQPLARPKFGIGTSTRSDSEISGPAPKFASGSVAAGSRCYRIRTPLRSNGHNFPLGY